MAGSFEEQVRAFAASAMDKADTVVAAVVQEVFYSIVGRSPVDTGFFRASWAYQVGSPGSVTIANSGSSESPIPPPTTLIVTMPAAGKVHYITNDLPYANRLEAGYSGQAPQGMVGLTVIEFSDMIRRAVGKVNP